MSASLGRVISLPGTSGRMISNLGGAGAVVSTSTPDCATAAPAAESDNTIATATPNILGYIHGPRYSLSTQAKPLANQAVPDEALIFLLLEPQKTAKNLGIVLTKAGGRALDLARGRGQLDRRGVEREVADGRMSHGADGPPRAELRGALVSLEAHHRRRCDPVGLAAGRRLLGRESAGPPRDRCVELARVGLPVRMRGEARSACPGGLVNRAAEPAPLVVARAGDGDPTVLT